MLEMGSETLDKHKVVTSVIKFNSFVEKNKDHQAYSDFKEGVNKGLNIAKYIFEENAEKFCLFNTDGDQAAKIKCLQDNFCHLLDRIDMTKKPNLSEDHLEGVLTGFERSKEKFREFIKESFPLENT
jgi:hypothetical protein